jgi:hypothetical protein
VRWFSSVDPALPHARETAPPPGAVQISKFARAQRIEESVISS